MNNLYNAPTADPSLKKVRQVAADLRRTVERHTHTLTQLHAEHAPLADAVKQFLTTHATLHSEADLLTLAAYSADDIAQREATCTAQRQRYHTAEVTLHNLLADLNRHAAQRPASLAQTDTLDTLVHAATTQQQQLTALTEQRVLYTRQLEEDERNRQQRASLLRDVEQKRAEYLRWESLNAHFGDATGNTFRNIALSYVLATLVRSACVYLKQLTDRYTLQVEPGTYLILLVDAYQGYVRRSVSTLSGGESFLVSLALALALSDMGGQRLAVDTLFIDEGFGTLSSDMLAHAVDTLRHLRRLTGRRVGIISHVDTLKECIPTQVRLQQDARHSASLLSVVDTEAQ